MVSDALLVYFTDGKRVILKPEVIYSLPSDPAREAEIASLEKQFGDFEQ